MMMYKRAEMKYYIYMLKHKNKNKINHMKGM